MTEDKASPPPWPGADERSVVEEMIRDQESKHWEECYELVKQRVRAQARNIPRDHHEEIIQKVMRKVTRALPGFQFQSAFRTWLYVIIERSIIDMDRELKKTKDIVALEDQFTEDDPDAGAFLVSEAKLVEKPKSAEDTFMVKEDLRRAYELIEEYVKAHTKPIRNRQIIRMVIEEGRSHEETAKVVGCNPPVVGYVVREAQRYVRERMEHKQL